MTIDEAIAQEREKAKEIRENIIDGDNLEPYESYCNTMVAKSAEKYEQIAEWLEELKSSRQELNELRKYSYVQGLSDGYINAIDDFVKKINESNQGHWRPTRYEHGEVVSETMSYDIGTIRLIAEQLKAGGKNE